MKRATRRMSGIRALSDCQCVTGNLQGCRLVDALEQLIQLCLLLTVEGARRCADLHQARGERRDGILHSV